ncbi:MAG: UvrD-helicase domain-containing protein [Treponema sp.]|nr:UvrD-helicase domain-containing protein [Treponema sp.]MCL2272226.1 UvrD-helicase domain-containing protein [Treponema sp.]
MDNKKIQPQLNEEQIKAAFCRENAVIAAGAGSGKTRVLANRFAWLLTKKESETNEEIKIDEILALTFTQKAAAEMYSRIHSLLTEIACEETGLKAEKARRALDDFIHARIQTLDSYSATLVRQSASRYGISPDFTIDQERCRQIALEESLPFLITHRHHPAIEMLYSVNRPDDIARNIFTGVLLNFCRIDKPVDFKADVKKQFNFFCIEWEKHCNDVKSILAEMNDLITQNNALLPDLVPLMEKYKSGKIKFPEISALKNYMDFLSELPDDSCVKKAETHPLQKSLVSILEFISEICALKLNKGKRTDNRVKENINQLRAIFGLFSSLAVFCMQAGFIFSIMSLLFRLQDKYLARKRSEGVLTFKDVSNLSRTILLEQHDIRQSEKESFKAIMIDEFQDNNELQKDILFLLAEKKELLGGGIPKAEDLSNGKLFFVGDEKQSVYLFRGADVSVFRKLKNELKSEDLPLKINYRSAPALIGAFNAIFGGSVFDPAGEQPLSSHPSIFAPEKDTPLPLYEASYTPLKKGINKSEPHERLSICILNKYSNSNTGEEADFLSADENEARFVAEKIEYMLKEKKYSPDDIAVLFRTRSAQYLYEKHLRLLGIPYTCEDINDFFYGGPVNDIMSALRLAAYPLDSISYAEMLRSPFAGLSLQGTALCLSLFKDADNPPVFDEKALEYLDEADREKFLHGKRIYLSVCENAAKENISCLVSRLWHKEGYRYETEWNRVTGAFSELYDYLFYLAVKADNANEELASFTDSMRSLRDSGGRLSDINIPLERSNAVRLMTIHKSKGLEFPVVFLCGCGKHSQSDRSDDVFYSDEAGIVFSAPLPPSCYSMPNIKNNFFWEKEKEEIKLRRTAELRRLLYVGMTRAEKELYITGSLEIRESEETEDFALALKKYTERKCEKNENRISSDTIINNDTFFGLLLPPVVSYLDNKDGAFFGLEEIKLLSEDDIKIKADKNPGSANDQKSLNTFMETIEPYYKKAQIIKTPVLYDSHRSPVSLKNSSDKEEDMLPGRGFFINRDFSGKNSDDIFKKVDSMLEKLSKKNDEASEKFNSGSFGTIAHICVEALLKKLKPVIPANITGNLNPSEETKLLEAGMEIARRFVDSPLGKLAECAKLRENEYPFRSIKRNKSGKEVFINGTIDLFFDDDKSIHVADFKTDNRETPSEHTAQMSCYYHAVNDLFALPSKKKCRIWLYYLRTGHAVEMTEKAKNFNLESRAFENY